MVIYRYCTLVIRLSVSKACGKHAKHVFYITSLFRQIKFAWPHQINQITARDTKMKLIVDL